MARSGFDIRFGYLRWLAHLIEGEAPGFADIGRAVGVAADGKPLSGQAVSGWARRDEAPDSYRNNKALSAYFAVEEDWLIGGEGAPPRPSLWKTWEEARRRTAVEGAIGSTIVKRARSSGAK